MTLEANRTQLDNDGMYCTTRTYRSSGQSLDYSVDGENYRLVSFDSHIRHRFAQIHRMDLLSKRLHYLDRLNMSLGLAATFGLDDGLRNSLGYDPEFIASAEVDEFNDAIIGGGFWVADIFRKNAAKLVQLTATQEHGVQPVLEGRHNVTGFAPVRFKPTSGLMDQLKNPAS